MYPTHGSDECNGPVRLNMITLINCIEPLTYHAVMMLFNIDLHRVQSKVS